MGCGIRGTLCGNSAIEPCPLARRNYLFIDNATHGEMFQAHLIGSHNGARGIRSQSDQWRYT